MTFIADMLTDRERERLAGWLKELEQNKRLLAEPGQQRPPDPPVPLARAVTANLNGRPENRS